jgi:hypothetical protein
MKIKCLECGSDFFDNLVCKNCKYKTHISVTNNNIEYVLYYETIQQKKVELWQVVPFINKDNIYFDIKLDAPLNLKEVSSFIENLIFL